MYFILILNFLLYVSGKTDDFTIYRKWSPRIVGGEEVTDIKQYSFQASLQIYGSHICGASIIDTHHVLTAAHCCIHKKHLTPYAPTDMRIGIGSTKLESLEFYSVQEILIHSFFELSTGNNDIAVIRVEKALPTPSLRILNDTVNPGVDCVVAGWGVINDKKEHPKSLMKVGVKTVNHADCGHAYKSISFISENMICAGGANLDSCQGDSGGALICDDKVAGIASWGDGCGKFPGVYTNVPKYRKWIESQFYTYKSVSTINCSNLYSLVTSILCLTVANKILCF